MNNEANSTTSFLIPYVTLRRSVGIIGTALPFVLIFGKIILESPGIESSVSAYYHTVMRDVLVGSLCAIGVFLLSYRGYNKIDNLAGDLACVFAVAVALLPTAPKVGATCTDRVIGMLHSSFAAGFLLTLAYFCLVLFRKTDKKTPTKQKKKRNVVYAVCGWTIIGCILLIFVMFQLPDNSAFLNWNPVFWFEAVAVVAFGVSWFIKGETIFKDKAA